MCRGDTEELYEPALYFRLPVFRGKPHCCVACLPVTVQSIVSYCETEYSSDCATSDSFLIKC
jgi:hypothetical protein